MPTEQPARELSCFCGFQKCLEAVQALAGPPSFVSKLRDVEIQRGGRGSVLAHVPACMRPRPRHRVFSLESSKHGSLSSWPAAGHFLWEFDNGTTPAPKQLVFSSSRGLLVGVHQARNLLGEGTAVGRTQFSAALQRASGFRGSAQVSATPAQLKALKQHASYPATSSKANLAFATHVEKALSSLDLLPPSLEHSFHQMYSQQANPPPPPVEEDPPPPPPAVAAQAPLHNDIYYGRVS